MLPFIFLANCDSARGYSLYLRPTMIGTQKTLGVGPPGSALLFVIASPVGPYYPTGFKAISLEATDYAVRAWPGGVGDKKLGANYAPCILPQLEAASRGFQQNLWLFGEEEYVTEVGTMNLFIALKNKETGKKELITAPLDGTILEGVTRDSVLSLARERLVPEGWEISERKIRMADVAEAAEEGRMIEVFGAGTAAIVSPVRNISYRGKMVDCGLKENEEAGEIALKMKNWIEGIQYGDEDHPWRYANSRNIQIERIPLLTISQLRCLMLISRLRPCPFRVSHHIRVILLFSLLFSAPLASAFAFASQKLLAFSSFDIGVPFPRDEWRSLGKRIPRPYISGHFKTALDCFTKQSLNLQYFESSFASAGTSLLDTKPSRSTTRKNWSLEILTVTQLFIPQPNTKHYKDLSRALYRFKSDSGTS